MPIFIDTGNFEKIKKFNEMGIIRGVTTNPTILSKEGIVKNLKDLEKLSKDISNLIFPHPLSLEVTSNDELEMIDQAKVFSSWSENINVKITIHGPNGELENLKVINRLENELDIRVNVTAMMSAQQCLIASLSGATYVSIFGGRVNNMGHDSKNEIKLIRSLLDNLDLSSKIIVGSTREIFNVIEWLNAGAHIITCTPNIIEGMIVHPYTKETVQMFLNDSKKINFKYI